jgi:voltage-gated potassium channel
MVIDNTKSVVLDQISPRRIFLVVLTILLGGAVFYHHFEKLSWLNSIYFCVVTLTTVGYGDITPKTDIGKLFTIFYILAGVGIIAASVSYLVKYSARRRIDNKQKTKA